MRRERRPRPRRSPYSEEKAGSRARWAYRLEAYAAAAAGYDVKLAVSYDGSTPALVVHGSPPATAFQGERGAIPFACQVLAGGRVYLNNDNTANQAVKVTGWRE